MAELPIACTLDAAAAAERAARWRRLGDRAGVTIRRAPDGVMAELRDDPEIAAELEGLVRLERDCCAFADWKVERGHGPLRLEVSAGDAGGAEAIRAMFGVSAQEPTLDLQP